MSLFRFLPLLAALCLTLSARGESPIPAFEAVSLTGEEVHSDALVGQPTVLIVTPSRDAGEATRVWVRTLHDTFTKAERAQVRVRDVIRIDLPFFLSPKDVLGLAREKVDEEYQDKTWLMEGDVLIDALGVPPGSHEAFVFVLNSEGLIVARVTGAPTEQRIQRLIDAVYQILDIKTTARETR